jgi:hypothetical protein
MVPDHEYNKTRDNLKNKLRKEGPEASNENSDDCPTVPFITEAAAHTLEKR